MSARPLKVIASIMAVLMGVSAPGLIAQAGFSRAVLQDHPLSVAGRHGVTARAEFAPGATAGLHVHPGEEFGYVIEGEVELSVEGRSPVTLQKGDVFFIPAGAPHDGRNPGTVKAAILSVFIAEQGKPLATPAK